MSNNPERDRFIRRFQDLCARRVGMFVNADVQYAKGIVMVSDGKFPGTFNFGAKPTYCDMTIVLKSPLAFQMATRVHENYAKTISEKLGFLPTPKPLDTQLEIQILCSGGGYEADERMEWPKILDSLVTRMASFVDCYRDPLLDAETALRSQLSLPPRRVRKQSSR